MIITTVVINKLLQNKNTNKNIALPVNNIKLYVNDNAALLIIIIKCNIFRTRRGTCLVASGRCKIMAARVTGRLGVMEFFLGYTTFNSFFGLCTGRSSKSIEKVIVCYCAHHGLH